MGVPRNPSTPFGKFLALGVVGSQFVHFTATDRACITDGLRYGVSVRTNRVAIVHGPMDAPSATPAVLVTITGAK